jgi:hypothetical protein
MASNLKHRFVLVSPPTYLRDGWHTVDHVATDRRHLDHGMQAYTTSGVIG